MLVVYLIIFAALAAVVLFQLYSVLGRRVGRQPEDGPAREAIRPLDDAQRALLRASAAVYAAKQRDYAAGLTRVG